MGEFVMEKSILLPKQKMKTKVCLSRYNPSKTVYNKIRLLTPKNPSTIATQSALMTSIMTSLVWSTKTRKTVVLLIRFMSEGRKETTFNEKVSEVQRVLDTRIVNAKPRFLNVSFKYLTDEDPELAHIRVAFVSNQGSWSSLGNDALKVDQDTATMNLSWLSDGNILHQFGHALGFLHENKYSSTQIPWDKPEVFAAFNGPPHYWNKLEVEKNVFTIFNQNQFLDLYKYNPESLMKNILPCTFFTQLPPLKCTDEQTPELSNDYSPGDKKAFAQYYPFGKSGGMETPSIYDLSSSTDNDWGNSTNLPDLIQPALPEIKAVESLVLVDTPFISEPVSVVWIQILAIVLTVVFIAIVVFIIFFRRRLGC